HGGQKAKDEPQRPHRMVRHPPTSKPGGEGARQGYWRPRRSISFQTVSISSSKTPSRSNKAASDKLSGCASPGKSCMAQAMVSPAPADEAPPCPPAPADPERNSRD